MATIDHTCRITLARNDEARPPWSLHMDDGWLTLHIWPRHTFRDWPDDKHYGHGYAGGIHGQETVQCGCGDMLSPDEWHAPLPEIDVADEEETARSRAAAEDLADAADELIKAAWPQWAAAHSAYGRHEDEDTGEMEQDLDPDVTAPRVYVDEIESSLDDHADYWALED